MDTDIPAEFVSVAADILGETAGGLSGNNIVKISTALAFDRGVTIPHGSYPFAAFNKRTAVYDNVMAFTGKDRFSILRALCERLEEKQPPPDLAKRLQDLRVKLFTRFGHLADTPSTRSTRLW